MSLQPLLRSPLWSWVLAAGIVWGPGFVALQLQEDGLLPMPIDKGFRSQQSTDEGGLITLRTPGGAKVAEFQTDGDTFEGIGDLSTKTAGTKSSITQFSTSEEKAVAWAMSMGYPVPKKMNGCATGLLVAVGLLCAIVPGILLLVWLGVQDNQYKRDMAALVAKWVDAGKPEPGEGAKEVTKLERVVEKIETPTASSDSVEQKLTELNSMKEKGLITDEEYQAMRKKALGL